MIYRTNHANLHLLIETEATIDIKDLMKFQNLLLGALSTEVDPEIWKQCIELCKDELRKANARQAKTS